VSKMLLTHMGLLFVPAGASIVTEGDVLRRNLPPICTLKLTLAALRVYDWRAVGFAAGTAGSGVAAAHVALSSETAAAFAAVGIGLNGIVTAVAAPVLARFFR
jgi:putative effector of murein hydrolase